MHFALASVPRPRGLGTTLAALLSFSAFACGGIALIDDGAGGDTGSSATGTFGNCRDLDLLADVPIEQCVTPTRCELRATLGGVAVVERCEANSCTLLVDGVVTCTCAADQIDFASTCNNGVPTCAGWKLDWTDVVPCTTK